MPSEEGDGSGGAAATASPQSPAAAFASPRASSIKNAGDTALSRSARPSSSSREGSARVPQTTGAERRRSSSVVVYPEAEDVGKPKMFARQSFIVSGEEEEMAETILKARQIAGERRRSTLEDAQVDSEQEAIATVAQNLAARRDSLKKQPDSTSAAVTAADSTTVATTSQAEANEVARRRSSVLNRIPDNLRALVQQSDAHGVQQKAESPYHASQQQPTPTERTSKSKADEPSDGSRPTSGTGEVHGLGWLRNILHFIRFKSTSRKKRNSRSSTRDRTEQVDTITPKASPTPGLEQSRSLLPKQLPRFAGRKQLILDLDETLVHSSFKPVPGADYIMDIMVDNTYYKVFVLKRPGVDEFLERVAKLYEVIIFTASLPQYANPLLDLLDPQGTITSRLFREHCTFHEGYFVKDLTLLRHESLESTIIVDNSPMAYMFQPENAVDCSSWIDEPDDTELYVIADFLEAIVGVPDVRDLLEFWREGGTVLENAC